MKPNKYENLNFNNKTSISCSRVRVIKTRSETIKIMSNSFPVHYVLNKNYPVSSSSSFHKPNFYQLHLNNP